MIETQSDNLFVQHVCDSFSVHEEQLRHGIDGELYMHVYVALMESTFAYRGRKNKSRLVLPLFPTEDDGSDDGNKTDRPTD